MPKAGLFSVLSFRNGVRAQNRVALAPMTNQQSHEDGSLSEEELEWLNRRAEGGFGLVATCASHVTLDSQCFEGELGIFDDRLLPGLRRLATAIRERGPLGLVQIFHGGAHAPSSLTGCRPWTASALRGDLAEARVGTIADIEGAITAFRDAAVRAHRAGFEGVEIHGAHGYLLCQFLSRFNTRADGWGGDLEGRARLLREVMRAVRAAVPDSFLVGVRLSPEDYGKARGWTSTRASLSPGGSARTALTSSISRSGTPSTRPRSAPGARGPALPRGVPHRGSHPRRRQPVDAARGRVAARHGRGHDRPRPGGHRQPELANPRPRARVGPQASPLTSAELRDRGVSEKFLEYMRRWKSFVAD